jgi:hypothetical protein
LNNGITKPQKYWLGRWYGHKEGQHNRFSYEKFQRCGQRGMAEKKYINCPDDPIWEVQAYEFHKDCLIFLEK